MRRGQVIPWFLTVLLSGCLDEVSQPSRVDDLRILAVRLDRPETRPDTTVRAEALVADPRGEALDAQYLWLACPLAFDAEAYECSTGEEDFFSASVAVGSPEAAFHIPANLLDPLPGSSVAPQERTVSIGVFVCAGGAFQLPESGFEQGAGHGMPQPACEGGTGLFAYKRLLVSRRADPNRNPGIVSVGITDTSLPGGMPGYPLDPEADNPVDWCAAEGECTDKVLRVTLDPSLIETYERTILDETGTVHEEPYISWFSTGGTLRYNRSIEPVDDKGRQWENTWNPENEGTFLLWVVVRDGRGGTDWISYRMKVFP